MTITVLVSAFAPFGNFHLSCDEDATIQQVFEDVMVERPLLQRIDNLRFVPTSRPGATRSTLLSELCEGEEGEENQALVSFRLTPVMVGGKGGFGSQLRAAGGRMSSKKTSNNDSCRDLSGRRLSTLKEAQKLAAYMENEPARKKTLDDAQKAKLAKLEKELGIAPGGSKEGQPAHAGMKRRLDDTEFLEESQAIVESVKPSVAEGLLKKRKRARLDPIPESESTPGSDLKGTSALGGRVAPDVVVA
ncbi:hypothetical protein FRB91_000341 [Serendipita sp. 411]|nr:hypothetical protein FRB91_000341 [Serendipita sp. 411]